MGKMMQELKVEVTVIESDTSCDHKPFQVTYVKSSEHNPFQVTSDENSDHNPFQATSDESFDHNPFQATFDESSDHNPFQVSSDETLKSSSKDTYEQRTVYKGRPWSSSRNAAIIKPEKPKSRSKHLVPTTPRTGLTCTTIVVLIKRPPLVTNYILGLAAIKTWQQILNKEFGIKRSKEDVGGSSYVRKKGKKKML
ncbi:hypothetical protein Tco_0745092 [Tanacetum coccineum]